MSNLTSDAAVEAVARALYKRDDREWIREDWDSDTDGLREAYRGEARALLATALLAEHVTEATE